MKFNALTLALHRHACGERAFCGSARTERVRRFSPAISRLKFQKAARQHNDANDSIVGGWTFRYVVSVVRW